MIKRITVAAFVTLSLLFLSSYAQDQRGFSISEDDDKLLLEQVTENVYAIVGPLGNRSANNHGNNATFGFVVTSEGVLLIDPGGTYKGAAKIHDVVKSVTDQPIKYVVNTGGQDHRWLGNDYFKRTGAKVIASKAAVADQGARLNDILIRLSNTAGDEVLEGTVESFADIQFDTGYTLNLGGVEFQIIHPGPAHSPGDAYVWLPGQRVVFSGDIIYMDRMLSLMSISVSKSWASAFESIESLQPRHIIPGHGWPTTLAEARASTYLYLTTLRSKIGDFIDAGGEIHDVGSIDQSQFEFLENYAQLKGRNAQQVFQEMEWEE